MKPYLFTLLMLAPAARAQVVAPAVLPAVPTTAASTATALPTYIQNDELIRRAWASNDPSLRQLLQVQLRSTRGVVALREPRFRAIVSNRLLALNRAPVPLVAPIATEAGYCVQCEIAALRSRLASLEAVAAATPAYAQPSVVDSSYLGGQSFANQGYANQGYANLGGGLGDDGLGSLLSSFAQILGRGGLFNQGTYGGGYYGNTTYASPGYFRQAYRPSPLMLRPTTNYGVMPARPSVLPALTSNTFSVAGYRAAPAVLPFR